MKFFKPKPHFTVEKYLDNKNQARINELEDIDRLVKHRIDLALSEGWGGVKLGYLIKSYDIKDIKESLKKYEDFLNKHLTKRKFKLSCNDAATSIFVDIVDV